MTIFPPSIQNDTERPIIVFKNISNLAKNDEHIVFPIPQSIQFTDSAAYNNSELGFTGTTLLNSLNSMGTASPIKSMLDASAAKLPKDLKSLAGLAGSKLLGAGELRSAIGIATGTTLNKNVVTEFSGVATRQFGFQFKLISASEQEANTVRNIINLFRLGLYPKGTSLQLQYPPTWYIDFLRGDENITHIPKIFETYLTTMSTSYNSSMNLFHKDGSPVETDLQLTFIESRALTHKDVESLIERPFEQGDFLRDLVDNEGAFNVATTAALNAVSNAFN